MGKSKGSSAQAPTVAADFNAANFVTVLSCGGEADAAICVTTKGERLLFNCPEGTTRFMTENKLKLSNKLRSIYLTRGSWGSLSGMIDVVLKAAEEGQRDLRLVGPRVADYARSTSYFLGQRPQMTLELHSLPEREDLEASQWSSTASADSGSERQERGEAPEGCGRDSILEAEGAKVTPLLLYPLGAGGGGASGMRGQEVPEAGAGAGGGAGSKRTLEQAAGPVEGSEGQAKRAAGPRGDTLPTGVGAALGLWGVAGRGGLPSGVAGARLDHLALAYSPNQRAATRRRAAEPVRGVASQDAAGRLAVSYAVELPALPGKFDAVQADALGVPKGPLRGRLVKGESVTLEDGRVVRPADCVGASVPGGAVLVLDCPSVRHAAALPASRLAAVAASLSTPITVVHMGAPAVLASEAYRRFVEAALPPAGGAVTHLVLDTAVPPERPLFVASERYLRLLHAIDPDFFPPSAAPYPAVLLHSSAKTAKLTPKPHPLLPGAFTAFPLLRVVLPPHKSTGLLAELPPTAMLHYYCLKGCVCPGSAHPRPVLPQPGSGGGRSRRRDGVGAWGWAREGEGSGEDAGVELEDGEAQGDKSGLGVERVVLLGTGAAAPFKYRTVSGIYVALEDGGGMLLDAGDGTYGALVRKFGEPQALRLLAGLKLIFVSHKHADHIAGTARILAKRAEALRQGESSAAGDSRPEGGARGGSDLCPFECSVCGAAFSYWSSLTMHHRAIHPRLPPPQAPQGSAGAAGAAGPPGAGAAGAAGGREQLVVVGPMWLHSWLRALEALEVPPRPRQVMQPRLRAAAARRRPEQLRAAADERGGGWVQPLDYQFVDCQELLGHDSRSGGDGGNGAEAREESATAGLEALLGARIRTVLVQHSFPAYGVVLHFSKGFKLVYSGDTRPSADLIAAGQGATLLLHEATHADEMRDKAMTDRHCTVEEAVGVARRMGAAYTVLTHFSSRFEKCMPDLSTYPGAETAQIGCAVDSMEVPVSRLGALKRVSRAACALLAAEYDLEEED